MSRQAVEVKKGNGRTGYRKPDAKRDRLSFRLSQDQLDLVKNHAFDDSEILSDITVSSELLHRLLERLVDEDMHPYQVDVELYPRVTPTFNLRVNPRVIDLVHLYWQGSSQATADLLITFAARQEEILPIHTPDQALELLRVFNGCRVTAESTIAYLTRKCSRKTAFSLLSELIQQGNVRAIDVQGRCPDKRIELPTGARLAYIELAQAI